MLNDRQIMVWLKAEGNFFYLLQNVQSGPGATTASNSVSMWSQFSGARVTEACSWPLRTSTVEVQTQRSYTSKPPSCLHGMNSDDFTYTNFDTCISSTQNSFKGMSYALWYFLFLHLRVLRRWRDNNNNNNNNNNRAIHLHWRWTKELSTGNLNIFSNSKDQTLFHARGMGEFLVCFKVFHFT